MFPRSFDTLQSHWGLAGRGRAFFLAKIAILIFLFIPRDVTSNPDFNGGFHRDDVYVTRKPTSLEDFAGVGNKTEDTESRFYLGHAIKSEKSNRDSGPRYTELPTGTRLKIVKVIWDPGFMHDGGGWTDVYAVIVDGPTGGKLVNINWVAKSQELERVDRGRIFLPDPDEIELLKTP